MSLVQTLRFIASHPLNRGRRFRSLVRFAKWQFGSRLVPGPVICQWIGGSRFIVRNGETGLTGNIYTGLHEYAEMAFLLHFLRSGDLFIDVGANVGSYTILACAVGARGYAFEPVPTTYERLIDNVRINRFEDRVKCIKRAVGRENGTVWFTGSGDTTNHVLEHCAEQAIEVQITNLDTALREESPVLLKIDVEGYEMAVLEGASALLRHASLQAVILETNGSGLRYGFDDVDLARAMAQYGFRGFSYDPLQRSLSKLAGKNCNSANTLFIRNEEFVAQRLQTAPAFRVSNAHI